MMEVWIVQFDCGDYYCEGKHLAGVFDSKERADEFRVRENPGIHGYNWTFAVTLNTDLRDDA